MNAPSFFVADPIVWVPEEPVPLAGLTDSQRRGWIPSPDGTFFWEPPAQGRGRTTRYLQAYNTGSDPDLGPGFQLASTFDDSLDTLRSNSVPRVKEYADALVADLIRAGTLPAEWRDPAKFIDPGGASRAKNTTTGSPARSPRTSRPLRR